MPSGYFIDWSKYDDLLISDLPQMTIVEWCAKHASHISSKAVGARARRIGVKPKRYRPTAEQVSRMAAGLKKCTPEMLIKIKELRATTPLRKLAPMVGISYATLTRILSEHGIKHYKCVTLECDISDQESLAKVRRRIKAETTKYDPSKARLYREETLKRFLRAKLNAAKRVGRKDQNNNPRPSHEVTITLPYLLKLWEDQGGRCKITGKKMEHKASLFAVSIDRIESDHGYVPGNVQLVCMAINLAKNRYSNADIIHFWNSESL